MKKKKLFENRFANSFEISVETLIKKHKKKKTREEKKTHENKKKT